MHCFFRFAPLALVLMPLLSRAQAGMVGLEIPAPPTRGHFLTGAYVVGAYTPLPTTSGFGYAMQPYLRYQLGSSTTGRQRPFVQYTFAPYRVANYGAGPFYGPDRAGLPANAGFAPLATRNALYGPYNGYNSYGGLGAFSVGIPMQIGRGTAVLSVGGTLLESALGQSLR